MNAFPPFPINDLNRETRDYLQKIWRQRGADHPGIFVKGSGFWWEMIAGLGSLVMLPVAVSGLQPSSLYNSIGTQCGLTAAGLVCLFFSIRALHRRFSSNSLGRFAYFDGTWYWEVGAHRVKVTDLSQVSGFQLVDHLTNGVRTSTTANLTFANGQNATFNFSNLDGAQRFARFLQICQDIRRQAVLGQLSPTVRQFVSEPGGLAQAARKFLDSGGGHLALEHRTVIPIPNPAALRGGRLDFGNLAWPWAAACGVFILGWFVFPPLRYAIDHNHHYAIVKSSPENDTEAPRTYLGKFPSGRRYEEVKALLDDRLFSIASSSVGHQHSPSAIRNYLAGQPHERHEEEARQVIARYYDEAIVRVQQLAAGQPTEQALLSGLLAILEYLKTQPTPRVSVAFQPMWTVESDDAELRMMELRFQSAYAQQDDVIARMVQNQGSAIVGTHDTFSEKQVRRRESIILRRLSTAVAKILSGDIIAFYENRGTQPCDITIHYEIKPAGKLIKYVRMPDERPRNSTASFRSQASATNTLGLLREYTIEWHLTIRPGATGKAYVYQLNSNSGTNLTYRMAQGDPQWGAYAVLMYSAFHDFSNRMISGVGLTPPPAPTTFTFHDAVVRQW
jgi:hypothetical protein